MFVEIKDSELDQVNGGNGHYSSALLSISKSFNTGGTSVGNVSITSTATASTPYYYGGGGTAKSEVSVTIGSSGGLVVI